MSRSPAIYMIDACSLTELRRTYPLSLFPQVWNLLVRLAAAGRLLSVEEVANELAAQDDQIADWAAEHADIFLPLSPAIQIEARAILKRFPTLIDLKKKKSGADPFLIAAARIANATVVTQEKRSGGPPAVKIPDVCGAIGVPCIALLPLLEAEGLES